VEKQPQETMWDEVRHRVVMFDLDYFWPFSAGTKSQIGFSNVICTPSPRHWTVEMRGMGRLLALLRVSGATGERTATGFCAAFSPLPGSR